jgi:hypothetical protein
MTNSIDASPYCYACIQTLLIFLYAIYAMFVGLYVIFVGFWPTNIADFPVVIYLTLDDNPVCCYEKSNKQFKSKLNII